MLNKNCQHKFSQKIDHMEEKLLIIINNDT